MKFIRIEDLTTTAPTTTIEIHHEEENGHGDGEHFWWSRQAWPILSVLAPLCVMGFLSNAIVVWVFLKWRVLRDRINLFIVNLAISNLAICIAGPPLIALPIFLAHAAKTEHEEVVTDLIYRISSCLFGMSCYANSFATTAIALYRRRMILKSRAQMQQERPQIGICLVMWGLSIVLAVPELFRCAGAGDHHDDAADEVLPTLLDPIQRLALEFSRVSLQFLLVSAMMIFSYVSVFFALRKRSVIRSQFQRDKGLKAGLAKVQYRKPSAAATNGAACNGQSGENEAKINHNKDLVTSKKRKKPRRPRITGSFIKAGAATVTTIVTADSLANGGPPSTSCDTGDNVVMSGPVGNGGEGSARGGLRSKVPSKMKHVWNSLRAKKFSASDSKNVCILIATIVVHFACWSPYNVVRFYAALLEAINDHVEPRSPIGEGIVLCIAVSSVLHCPIFYTWFNRRNRHGLVACCAAVIPCRDSILRQRLKEMAHEGNSHRLRLPLPIDSPRTRAPRRPSRLQHALLRRQQTSFAAELRQILYNTQRRTSTSSQGPPPARHNSFLSGDGSVGASEEDGDCPFQDISSVLINDISVTASGMAPSSLLIFSQFSQTNPDTTPSVQNHTTEQEASATVDEPVTSSKQNNSSGGDAAVASSSSGRHAPVRELFSTEQLQRAITELARNASDSSTLTRSTSTHSCRQMSNSNDDTIAGRIELLEITKLLDHAITENEQDPTCQKFDETVLLRTPENLQELKLRRALSSRPARHRVRFDSSSSAGEPADVPLRRNKTMMKKPMTTGQFLTVPEKYPTTTTTTTLEPVTINEV